MNAPSLPCWTVATQDKNENSWVLETRYYDGKMEARLRSVDSGTIIFGKEGNIQVNNTLNILN